MAVDPDKFEPDDLKSIPTFRAAYSDRTALLMARLARRAYRPFDANLPASLAEFTKEICDAGFLSCDDLIDAKAGTAGYLVVGADLIVIVFRGTENEMDWKTNVQAEFHTLQGGTRVHRGFFQAYKPIRGRMFDAVLKAIKAKPRPVYITGHSLGGALALMATAELANHDDAEVRDSIAACYTFGCPRAGDGTFDLYVKVPLYRITNGVDIVPAVPPAVLGYRHVGDSRHFGARGSAPSRNSPGIVNKTSETFSGLLQLLPTGKLRNVSDHDMTEYIDKLSAWIEKNSKDEQKRRAETADTRILSEEKK
jgi:hypothetical protein